ncbi:MAG TPA: twin-arginine translocase subunit TatC, partial [Acidobacteriota bacterium]|nr:twin-arginine translocase subunit TatC [Acidobacteriota bacterium]
MNDPNRPSGVPGSSSDPEENTGDNILEDYPSGPKTDEERVPAENPTSQPSSSAEADSESSDQAIDTSSAGGSGVKGPPPEDDDFDEFDDEETELGGRMTFLEHLDELRRRILYSVIAIVATFVVAWIFREPIFQFLSQPILRVVPKLVVI